MTSRTIKQWCIGVATVAALGGCGGAAPPSTSVATATGAVRAAEEAGAVNTPSAALELRLAKEEMALAQRMIRDDQNERAAMVLRRAEVDAQLARAIAREESTHTAADASETQLRSLQTQP